MHLPHLKCEFFFWFLEFRAPWGEYSDLCCWCRNWNTPVAVGKCSPVTGSVHHYFHCQKEEVTPVASELCSHGRLCIFEVSAWSVGFLWIQHVFIVMFYGEVKQHLRANAHLFLCQFLWLRWIQARYKTQQCHVWAQCRNLRGGDACFPQRNWSCFLPGTDSWESPTRGSRDPHQHTEFAVTASFCIFALKRDFRPFQGYSD